MINLLDNWRSYIKEGKSMENFTTLISRRIINVLKDEDLKDAFSQEGEVLFKLEAEDILSKIKNVNNVYVNLLANNFVYSNAKYEFDLDATEEQRKNSDIIVNIVLPIDYSKSHFNELIPELKDSLRHELEHSTQPTEMLMNIQKEIPDGDIWKSYETAKKYYTDESEVKAHIAGLYKKAKTIRQPLIQVIDEELYYIYNTGLSNGLSAENLDPLFAEIRELWHYYALSRYPHAEMEYIEASN
jgi:hypothetical protein